MKLANTKGPHIQLDFNLAAEIGIQRAIVLSWFLEQFRLNNGPVSFIEEEIQAVFHWWKPTEIKTWIDRLARDSYLIVEPDSLLTIRYSLGDGQQTEIDRTIRS